MSNWVLGDKQNHPTDSLLLTIKTVSQERIQAVVKPFFNQALGKSLYELEKKTN